MVYRNECNFKIFISFELLNIFYELVGGDSFISVAKPNGQICLSSAECQMYSHCKKAEKRLSGVCECLPGFISTDTWIQCIEPRQYKDKCEYSEQCRHFDPNTICDKEGNQSRLKCLCNDYYKYNYETQRCQWCEEYECRRLFQRYGGFDDSYSQRYNRWYHNVNDIFGMWASLLIIAIPLSLFLFFLGIRFTKHLIRLYTRDLSVNFHRNETNNFVDSVQSTQHFFVRLPEEEIPTESPPDYENLSKTIRLPTYEEAITMPLSLPLSLPLST